MSKTVAIKLNLTLQKYAPAGAGGTVELEMDFPCTAGDVLRRLHIPEQEPVLITLNGRQVLADEPVQAGDALKLFPLLAGG
ncbi:MoaD/ThiS family protein [Paradesulfitobacterium ferrireducens]|uniref:MoaD/ThiS family protein n=1 Tax=Paradesulfitobacterium ferrireducens TaxID=2816476 RepID=UPI001A8EAB61|nr:MoaD/ThiS family protein [Paradesulfitobacterium ferrireducens]